MSSQLPTWDEMRHNAYKMLSDTQDELRSDWRSGTGPATTEAANARIEALVLIEQAKDALNRAARS